MRSCLIEGICASRIKLLGSAEAGHLCAVFQLDSGRSPQAVHSVRYWPRSLGLETEKSGTASEFLRH